VPLLPAAAAPRRSVGHGASSSPRPSRGDMQRQVSSGSSSSRRYADAVEDLSEAVERPRFGNRWLTRLWARAASYSGVFVLGILCSSRWWPENLVMREKVTSVTSAAAVYANTSNEYLGEFVDRLMNGTLMIREVLDNQASSFRGRVQNASLSMQDIFSSMKVPSLRTGGQEEERIGVFMAKTGAKVHHPVVMIPGIITTGLEVWDGEACIRSYFRQRIWGSTSMLQSLLSDPDCWARHLALNSTTGLDPLQSPHFNRSIRVRPSQGFESADFFVGGYWLWGIMIEALADIGYDYNSMHMASYDWRLAFGDLEVRDRYFTRLRQHVEMLVSMSGKKAVVVCHSMGSNVWHYFMQWVTHRVHRNWVHDHIYSEVGISAPMLGLPKAFYSMLTGDNRDFASMGRGFSAVMTHMFGPMTRRRLWRSCSALAMIIPIGGESIWGEELTGCPLVRVGNVSLDASASMDLLGSADLMPEELRRIAPWLLDGVRRSRPPEARRGEKAEEPPEHAWGNVLAAPLPFAPEMQKYAFYGVGVPTDVSATLEETGDDKGTPRYTLKRDATEHFGFELGNGDYAVPLRSLGLMCMKGWKDDRRNPARTPCTIREYLDNPQGFTFEEKGRATLQAAKAAGASPAQMVTALLTGGYSRGGQPSGDHIDILGNREMLQDLLTVVSGGQVQERIISDIQALADRWDGG